MSTQSQFKGSGRESSDLPLKPFLWILAGLIAAALFIHLILICYAGLLGSGDKGFGRLYQIRSNQVPRYPAPALQSAPQVDYQAYRSQVEQDLNSFAWIDRAHGVVKIPIARAMILLSNRGFSVRPTPQDGPTELDMQRQKAAADSVGVAK